MTIKDRIMEKAGDKYVCLENENVDNTDVITIANRDSDALLLNYEIGDSMITVNVVNKDEGSIVDNYSTEYDDSSFDNKIDTSIATYEAIKKSVAHKLAEAIKSYTDEDVAKFRAIIANGGSRDIYKLPKDELKKMYDFVSDCDDYKSARALILWQVRDAIDDLERPEKSRRKFEDDSAESDVPEEDIPVEVEPKEDCIEFTDASVPDLLQACIDKLDIAIEEADDENKKVILDDVSAQLVELLDEVSSYVEE